MPGNPMAAYINEQLGEEDQKLIMAQFGLDRPLYEQYVIYLANLAQGNLGVSFFRREPVWNVILSALPNTLILTTTGLLLAYAFGILAGAWLATKRGTLAEGIAIPAALATRAAPEFWIGMILLSVFAFWLGWLPGGGANKAGAFYGSEWSRIFSADFLSHLLLPALTLALYLQGLPLLLMRSTMLEVLNDEFVTMARIKGLPEWRITLVHAARNALLPIVTRLRARPRRDAWRQCRGGDGLLLARPRPPARRGCLAERLSAGAGRILRHHPRADHPQLPRRHGLRPA